MVPLNRRRPRRRHSAMDAIGRDGRYAPSSGRSHPSAAMVWIGNARSAPRQEGQASSDIRHWRRHFQKSPIRRCFKPRTPLSAGIAGFASGCRSHEQESEITFLGGCPASCPDAHRSTHGHRHVRKRALNAIIQLSEESTIYRARSRASTDDEWRALTFCADAFDRAGRRVGSTSAPRRTSCADSPTGEVKGNLR
jgi:hypothetical protein